MKDSIHESSRDNNRSMSNDSIQKKSNQEGLGFEDNSPEAQQAARLQAMADNSPEAIQMRKFQANIDNSEGTKQLMSFNQAAKTHDATQLQEEDDLLKQKNNTGLPDNLKTGMENLSGISLDDVKVHRNSDKPAQLQAHAYAQGTDIHLGPGQEQHLPHEAWHVVQQKQGRVKPTLQMKGGVDVNDDGGLEREADVMGGKALHIKTESVTQLVSKQITENTPIQMFNELEVIQELPAYLEEDQIEEEQRIPINYNGDNSSFLYGALAGRIIPTTTRGVLDDNGILLVISFHEYESEVHIHYSQEHEFRGSILSTNRNRRDIINNDLSVQLFGEFMEDDQFNTLIRRLDIQVYGHVQMINKSPQEQIMKGDYK